MTKIDDIVFNYNLQMNEFRNELALDKALNQDELTYDEISEREYDHANFGFCYGDDILARNHFYMQIRNLDKININKDAYLNIACDDLDNYVFACRFCGEDIDIEIYKRQIKRMIVLILANGGQESIYQKIKELYKETIQNYNQDSSADSDFFLDFFDLYERYGDYMLFVKKDTFWALKFYELASLDWYDIENQKDWHISEKDKRVIIDRTHKFAKINELLRNPRKAVILWEKENRAKFEGEENYKNNFIAYMKSLKREDGKQICINASRFFRALKRMRNEKCKREELRLPLLLAYYIQESSLEYMLDVIWKNADIIEFDDITRQNIFKSIRKNHSKTLAPIREYINKVEENEQVFKNCFDLLKVREYTKNIAGFLKRDNSDKTELAYYTSVDTFSYMLPFKAAEGMLGRLSIMNIAYMNDPNEGKTLQKYLFSGQIPFEGDGKRRKNARYPYVYIKCFTPQIDFLPMWEMYGDHAQGCCLVIDWKKIGEAGTDVPLYNVCYLSKVGKEYKVEQQYNMNLNSCKKIEQNLKLLSELCKLILKEDYETLLPLQNILNEILYLFKDVSYSYEREVRICYQYPEVNSEFEHTPGAFGKLYVATNFLINLKEIILGPKFLNRTDVMPYLQEQVDIMCQKLDMNVPKITSSDIALM